MRSSLKKVDSSHNIPTLTIFCFLISKIPTSILNFRTLFGRKHALHPYRKIEVKNSTRSLLQ
ncbi:hypothetical protein L873DRAFT_1806299, partial [Choiromyces venosus 120613-1]